MHTVQKKNLWHLWIIQWIFKSEDLNSFWLRRMGAKTAPIAYKIGFCYNSPPLILISSKTKAKNEFFKLNTTRVLWRVKKLKFYCCHVAFTLLLRWVLTLRRNDKYYTNSLVCGVQVRIPRSFSYWSDKNSIFVVRYASRYACHKRTSQQTSFLTFWCKRIRAKSASYSLISFTPKVSKSNIVEMSKHSRLCV